MIKTVSVTALGFLILVTPSAADERMERAALIRLSVAYKKYFKAAAITIGLDCARDLPTDASEVGEKIAPHIDVALKRHAATVASWAKEAEKEYEWGLRNGRANCASDQRDKFRRDALQSEAWWLSEVQKYSEVLNQSAK